MHDAGITHDAARLRGPRSILSGGWSPSDARRPGHPSKAPRAQAALERRWPPTWVVVRDLSGSRIRIRTRDVCGIFECTAAQRAADRRFQKACEREARGDDEVPPWETC